MLIDDRVVHVGSRKALALLAVLALEGPVHAPDWPPCYGRIRTTQARDAICDARYSAYAMSGCRSTTDAQSLALAPSLTDCDVLDAQAPPSTGILLDGFDRLANGEFSDWLSNWRRTAGAARR